jgi:hypothetical protein
VKKSPAGQIQTEAQIVACTTFKRSTFNVEHSTNIPIPLDICSTWFALLSIHLFLFLCLFSCRPWSQWCDHSLILTTTSPVSTTPMWPPIVMCSPVAPTLPSMWVPRHCNARPCHTHVTTMCIAMSPQRVLPCHHNVCCHVTTTCVATSPQRALPCHHNMHCHVTRLHNAVPPHHSSTYQHTSPNS